LQLCRGLGALTLATNSSVSFRWIASEFNPADEPSRRLERFIARSRDPLNAPFSVSAKASRSREGVEQWRALTELLDDSVPADSYFSNCRDQSEAAPIRSRGPLSCEASRSNRVPLFEEDSRPRRASRHQRRPERSGGGTVSAPVLKQYELFKRRFDAWLSDSARSHTLRSAEVNIVDYLDVLLQRNANYGELEKSTAAVIFFTPGAAKHDMPRVRRALNGCLKAKPPRSRLPLPDEVIYGLAGILLSLGHKAVALMVILGKEVYVRPMEMVNLKCEDLRAPVGGAQVGLQYYTVTVAPEDRFERSKTGISDDTIVLDRPDWLGPSLMELKKGRAGLAPLFSLDLASGIKLWDIACHKLWVKAHRYQLLHAGVSSDMLARRRTVGEIMARGRWAAIKSVRRYAKGGSVQKAAERLAPGVRLFCQQMERDLPRILKGEIGVVVPDFSALPEANLVR